MESEATDKVIYLLGLTPESGVDSIEIDGLGYSISSISHLGVRCWYVAFDSAEFQGADAAANLEDLEWLTPRVIAHQHAIDHLGALGPLYPARFATLFSSLEALRESVSVWHSALQLFFERVSDKEEWSCKIYLSKTEIASPSDTGPDKPNSSDGRGYLLARRRASEAKLRQAELISQVVDEVHQLLTEAQLDVVRRPNVQLDRSDEDLILVANLAMLIRHEQVAEIQDLTSHFKPPELLQRELSIELSGPFAAYSFCTDLAAI
jgi:hypothetical protein